MLYTLIPEERLSAHLAALAGSLDLSISLLDAEGNTLQQHGAVSGCCTLLRRHVFTPRSCAREHLKAGQIAATLGESYVFSCPANLNHIAFPLVRRGVLAGTVIVGPFLMDQPDSSLIAEVLNKHRVAPTLCLEIFDELTHLPVVPPHKARHISGLVEHLLSPLLGDERLLMQARHEKLYQQSRINETIQMYKGEPAEDTTGFVYGKEQELLARVKTGDIQAAKAVLNDLLGFVLFTRSSQMAYVRARALELTTLLSRVAIEGGATPESSFALNNLFLPRIQHAQDFESLCHVLQEAVENFMHTITVPLPGHAAVRKALQFIALHYQEPLSIQTMGSQLNMSPAYFSSLFSQHMRMGFRDYLARVRNEQAKYLLQATDYPISQIAAAVGYADQSSFTKAFRRVTGLTPHQAR